MQLIANAERAKEATSTNEKSSFYHPELDALRFSAFLQVFYFHLGTRYIEGHGIINGHGWASRAIVALVWSGALGVDLFFCLSSFLITALLLREYDLTGTLNVKQFWIRRILRIWPLYYFFLTFVVYVLPHIGSIGKPLSAGYAAAFALFGGNWACVFSGTPPSVIAPLWSVSVEEQFYLLWPLLLFLLTPRRLAPLAIGGLVLASLTRIVLVLTGAIHSAYPVLWMNTFTRVDPIAIGALCAVAVRKWNWYPPLHLRAVLAAVGLGLPLLLMFLLSSDGALNGPWSIVSYPIIAVSCACMLGAIYSQEPIRVPWFLIYLGRISYGLYVFHMLSITIANYIPQLNGPSTLVKIANAGIFVAATSALTLAMAALSYRFLEQRFLRLKSKFAVVQSAPVKVPHARCPAVPPPDAEIIAPGE